MTHAGVVGDGTESGAIADIQNWRVSLDLGEMRKPKDLSRLGKQAP